MSSPPATGTKNWVSNQKRGRRELRPRFFNCSLSLRCLPHPKASPCQGRCQKSLIFDGGVVKIGSFSLPQSASLTAPSSEGALVRWSSDSQTEIYTPPQTVQPPQAIARGGFPHHKPLLRPDRVHLMTRTLSTPSIFFSSSTAPAEGV